MSFVAVSGTVTITGDTDTRFEAWDYSSPDALVLTFNNGYQVKVLGYQDDEANDVQIGRPVGEDFLNFYMYGIDDNPLSPAGFQLADMSDNVFYTFVAEDTGGYAEGSFRFEWNAGTSTFTVWRDDAGYIIDSNGNYSAGSFTEGTPLYQGPVCFLPGTQIGTPAGDCAIESLAIGNLVITASGAQKTVKWIGCMSIPLSRFNREVATPVCIKAGALGSGLPQRDLYVSADHAFFIDGLLINAGVLVNGGTIVRCTDYAADVVEYFQVELEDHDLVLAEGAAAETFFEDGDNRATFDNAAEFHALYPQHVRILPMPYGRVTSARLLPRSVRERFFGKRVA